MFAWKTRDDIRNHDSFCRFQNHSNILACSNLKNSDNNAEADELRGNNRRLMVAGMLAGTTVFGTVALMAPFVFGQIRSPLPYMATPGHKVRQALEHCLQIQKQRAVSSATAGKTNDLTFVDLGSGDGEAVYQAVKLGYSKAIGVELNFTLYCLSQFRRYVFWSTDQRRRSAFYCKDFFQTNLLGEAQTVMIFGVQPLMARISQKLNEECQPGTHILAYRFRLPLNILDDEEEKENDNELEDLSKANFLNAQIIYDEEEMRIYERKL